MDRNLIDYIKSIWDCLSYCQNVLALPVRNEGDRCKSFRPDAKRNDSLLVYRDYFFDWGADLHGDVIDLSAYARHNGDKGAAIRELAGDNFYSFNSNWEVYSQELQDKISYWHECLRTDDINYLHSRRISDETIQRLMLGFDPKTNRLVIPYWKNNRVAYYVSRDRSNKPDAAKYKKAFIDECNEHIPWGLHTLSQAFNSIHPERFLESSDGVKVKFDDWLCVLEGAFDAMSFEQAGFHVLSPICGYFNREQKNTFLAAARNFPRVFICFDSDSAGSKFQLAMSKFCFSHRIKFSCGFLPHGIKDVSDYYAAGGNLADLVAGAKDGVKVLAQKFTDKNEFATFLHDAARFCSKTDLLDICSNALQFPEKWRGVLYSECSKAPTEKMIADLILKNHTLKYIVDTGFFEYLHGVWVKTPDDFIKKYIIETLGVYASASRASAVCSFLKSLIVSDEKFNTQNIFNFINGVLNLDSLELEKHSPTFMSSVQAKYNYDKNANAPRWLKFINEVMQGNQEKISLLQECAGYVLFSDCSHEKAFMLLGDGSNGKSVFINTLINVFGPENCSNVGISDLASPFDPIRLRYSIANFATEQKSNIKGTEDTFKKAVSGEIITAAYKGVDAIEFAPRAKWIFAANNFMAANDSSAGFGRRWRFIKFEHTFSGSEIDRDLTSKLRKELPGIFNWVLEGYTRLKKNGEFTPTEEMNDLKNEFMKTINPVELFYSEEITPLIYGFYSTKELYEKYTSWCKAAGNSPQSRINFTRNIRQILARERPAVSYIKNGVWGFKFPEENYLSDL